MSNIFELTAFMNPSNPIIRWLWLANDGSIGYTEDDYMKNMNHHRFIRPQWNISTVHTAVNYITTMVESSCVILQLLLEYNEVELIFNIKNITTYVPINIKEAIINFEKELNERILSRSILDKMTI